MEESGTQMSSDTNKRGPVGAVVGWVLYAVGIVIWFYSISLSVASKVGSSEISIENELILFAGVGFALLSGIGLGMLTAKLGDTSKAAKLARYMFLALAPLAVVGWLVPVVS